MNTRSRYFVLFPNKKEKKIRDVVHFDEVNMKYYIKFDKLNDSYYDFYEMKIEAQNDTISMVFLFKNGFQTFPFSGFDRIKNNIKKHIVLHHLNKPYAFHKLVCYITYMVNRLSRYDIVYRSPHDVFAYINGTLVDEDRGLIESIEKMSIK